MDDVSWDATFEDFIASIVLTNTQAKRIDSSLINLSRLFLERLELNDLNIYAQGSFATSTTVKPLTASQSGGNPGEYDVDIVLESSEWGEAKDALGSIEDVLKSHEFYASRVSGNKKPACERIEYSPDESGVGYHVDIVPIRKSQAKCERANRNQNAWLLSEPKKLSDWLNGFADNNQHFRSMVLIAKRLRDVLGITDILPSTILIVLLAQHYKNSSSYIGDFMHCLEVLDDKFNEGASNLTIINPVQSEDLAERYRNNPSEYEVIGRKIREARNALMDAFMSQDLATIRQYLSDDFPSLVPQNVQSLRAEGYSMQTDGSFERGSILSESQYGQVLEAHKRVFFEVSKPISFLGDSKYKNERVYWQVCNAPGSKELRGNWFPARATGGGPGSSTNPLRNSETEVYTGEHWTRYAAINVDDKVVSISRKYRVEVRGNQPRFPR